MVIATSRPNNAYDARQPNAPISVSIRIGNTALASAVPMPSSPIATPRLRTNQMAITCALTSVSAPCPSARISVKPISSVNASTTMPIHAHASANADANTITAVRGPRRSMNRPENGKLSEPSSVPPRYRADTPERDSPRSAMMWSRKTETPVVWPGFVIIAPSVPAAMTHQP